MAKLCWVLILSSLRAGAINILKLTIMIKIADIIRETLAENDNNAYYWDALNDTGYHVHVLPNGKKICMKAKGLQVRVISEEDFIDAVNEKCCGNAISANNYYGSL